MAQSKQVILLEGGLRIEAHLLDSGLSSNIYVFRETGLLSEESHQKPYGISVEQVIEEYGQGRAVLSNTTEPIPGIQ